MIQASRGTLFSTIDDQRRVVTPQVLKERAERATLVVVDEMATPGAEKDWHYACIKDLIDLRYGLPLILLSNLDLESLVGIYDARLVDRLKAGTVFHLKDKSRRQRLTPRAATEES